MNSEYNETEGIRNTALVCSVFIKNIWFLIVIARDEHSLGNSWISMSKHLCLEDIIMNRSSYKSVEGTNTDDNFLENFLCANFAKQQDWWTR